MTSRAVFLVSCLVAVLAAGVQAQPTIDLVEGAWADDDTVRIYGLHFGAKEPAAPLLWDTIENQDVYNGRNLSHGDQIPVKADGCEECPWNAQIPESWGNPIYYWTQDTRVPDVPIYHFTTKGYFRLHDLGVGTPDVVYVNWWFRTSGDISGASNKFIRVWEDSDGENRTSFTAMHLTCDLDVNHDGLEDPGSQPDWGDWGGVVGGWNNLEIICDGRGDLAHGYGHIVAKTNNVVQHDVRNFSGDPLNLIYSIGMDAGIPDNTRGFEFDMADIYVDTSMARILVGDEPFFSDVTHAEVQIPVAWRDDVVTVQVNRGSFDLTRQHYLYVFDEYGNHNEAGYSLEPGVFPGRPSRPQR